jgi:ABC-type transporter Mla MlaB component
LADPARSSATPPESVVGVVVVGWPVGSDDLAALCDRVAARLTGQVRAVVLCDVTALTGADLAAVDALARLQIVARRHGGEIRLTNAPGRLIGLLRLVGLARVIRTAGT